ncbi:MAG: tetratricopeptide repeat protein [Acidobacteria bacterium]|nr:tetratricopeptide repeat protein [Acidobacteriota bacterium]
MNRTKRDPVDIACEIHARAESAFELGRQERGMRWCRRALSMLNDELGHDHPDVANVQNSLGAMMQSMGRLEGAEACFRDSVELMDRIDVDMPEVHIIRSQSLMNLGNVIRERGHYREAEPYLRRAVEEAERHLAENREALAVAWNALGMFCKYTGKFDEGIALYDRALAASIAEFGPEHPDNASIYHNIGGIHHARGAFAEAEEPARRSVEIRKAALGEDHPAVAADEAAYAAILDELGRFEESAKLYEHALQVFRGLYGEEHYEIAVNLNNLAAVAANTGDAAQAERLYRQGTIRTRR